MLDFRHENESDIFLESTFNETQAEIVVRLYQLVFNIYFSSVPDGSDTTDKPMAKVEQRVLHTSIHNKLKNSLVAIHIESYFGVEFFNIIPDRKSVV